MQLDYSSLSREHKAVSEGKERDKLAAQFQADIDERSSLLAKLAPNLKAVEQYEAVKVSLYAQLAHTGGDWPASGICTTVWLVAHQAVPCSVLSMAEVACFRSCWKSCNIKTALLVQEHVVKHVGHCSQQLILSCDRSQVIATSA